MEQTVDFLIVGAGMAGASAGYYLADHGRCVILEAEDHPGYHTTGRSAAFYAESYGGPTIAPLTIASRPFLIDPPAGFAEAPLTHRRGALHFFETAERAEAERRAGALSRQLDNISILSIDEALEWAPAMRRDRFAGAILDSGCMDLDVAAMHQGFLKGFRRKGGKLCLDAPLKGLVHDGRLWQVQTPAGPFTAPVVVNAAGAWGDAVASLAGIAPVGLQPMRRTVIVFTAGGTRADPDWPLTLDLQESFYFKPESGRILGSPADETPVAPCDVQPEEMDIAIAVDRIEKATTMTVARIENKWAGLRTFAPDRTPVIGFDPQVPGFFWCVGQGGYGIQTAPAIGEVTAALASGAPVPQALKAAGVDPATYAPGRFGNRRAGAISSPDQQSTGG